MRSQILSADSRLKIKLQQNSWGKTIITHKYSNHPLSISRPFYLDNYPHSKDCSQLSSITYEQNRAYLYLGNNSPGLFPGDYFQINLDCGQNTKVYLTDRAATKVYPSTKFQRITKINYQFKLAAGAYLEFVPEALILYQDAALEQMTKIYLESNSELFLSEIILPGRLARGESYLFHSYYNRLQVYSLDGDLLFKDGMYLSGLKNHFKASHLFAQHSIIGNAIAVLPPEKTQLLQTKIEHLAIPEQVLTANSLLPNDRGLLIKVNAAKTALVKHYFSLIINLIRSINHDAPLPYIPK